jgi:hypothetical protein
MIPENMLSGLEPSILSSAKRKKLPPFCAIDGVKTGFGEDGFGNSRGAGSIDADGDATIRCECEND